MELIKWKWGQKVELAKLAGCSPQQLSDILSRRARGPVELSRKLELGAARLGLVISRFDFMESDTTDNPLFKPKEV